VSSSSQYHWKTTSTSILTFHYRLVCVFYFSLLELWIEFKTSHLLFEPHFQFSCFQFVSEIVSHYIWMELAWDSYFSISTSWETERCVPPWKVLNCASFELHISRTTCIHTGGCLKCLFHLFRLLPRREKGTNVLFTQLVSMYAHCIQWYTHVSVCSNKTQSNLIYTIWYKWSKTHTKWS
jgi:hypothetical protein